MDGGTPILLLISVIAGLVFFGYALAATLSRKPNDDEPSLAPFVLTGGVALIAALIWLAVQFINSNDPSIYRVITPPSHKMLHGEDDRRSRLRVGPQPITLLA